MKVYKAYLAAAVLAFGGASYAAEWSPVFEHLQARKHSDDGQILDAILGSFFKENISSRTKEPLTADAKSGHYKKVPLPYRNDMLPAKAIKNKDGIVLQGNIPLKNATLYGQPIKSLNYLMGCYECDDVGFNVTFAPMSDAQYQTLKQQVKFKTADSEGCMEEGTPVAEFDKEGRTVYLYVYIGC